MYRMNGTDKTLSNGLLVCSKTLDGDKSMKLNWYLFLHPSCLTVLSGARNSCEGDKARARDRLATSQIQTSPLILL